jgi:hypothetical protein
MDVSRVATHARVRDLALTRDGRTLYLAGEFAGLLAMDAETDVVRTVSRIPCPESVAAAPGASLLFVGYECGGPGGRSGHDTIEVLDAETGSPARLISGLASVTGRMAVSPDGSQLWVDGRNACIAPEYDHAGCPAAPSGILNVVRPSDGALLRALPIGTPDLGWSTVSFTPDGSRAIVGHTATLVLDTATLAVVESAPVATHAPVVFSPAGATAYAAFGEEAVISALPMTGSPRPPDGLTGRWLADGTPNDAAGYAAQAVVVGSVGYASGRVGQAFRFEGTGGIEIPTPGNLGIYAHPFTIAMWATFSAGEEMIVANRLHQGASGRESWVLFRTQDGRLAACFAGPRERCDGTATVRGSTELRQDSWHHIALVFTGASAALYVDGRLDAEAAVTGYADSQLSALRFAGAAGPHRLRGLLDEIEVYDRALGASEIKDRVEAARR